MSSHYKKASAAGLLVALGIIYGDIGTSPLYTFQTILTDAGTGNKELVFGAISCIFRTLTLQTTFKYDIITLQADNHGEGGVFSLYALVKRYGKKLVYPAIIGAGTLLADGIITPPITVMSAIEGLNMVKVLERHIVPGNDLVLEIVLVILLLLFIFQRFGTKVVGASLGQRDHPLPGNIRCPESRIWLGTLIRTPKWFLAAGSSVSLYYRGGSALFGFRSLRKKEHTGKLDIR